MIKRKVLKILVGGKYRINRQNLIYILSFVAGIGGGIAALLLKTSVFYLHEHLLNNSLVERWGYLIFILPAVGILLTVLFKNYVVRDHIKHNIAIILEAISKRNSRIKPHKTFSSIIGGILTAGFGGSIGLESPIISSGSAVGSSLGRLFKLGYKEVTLLLSCGAAGAISAIFHTPVAAVVFAIEVLLIDLTRYTLIPLLIASISGAVVTNIFYQDAILFEFILRDEYVVKHTGYYLILGVLTGIVSVYFMRVFLKIENFFNRWQHAIRLLVGGIVLGVLILLFPPLYGEGYGVIKAIFSQNYDSITAYLNYDIVKIPILFIGFFIFLLLLKVVATAVTVGSGGIGGIFAPALFTGAILGMLFAYILNITGFRGAISEGNFALCGMAGLLSGVLHAPLTGIFLIAETTQGYELIVPLMMVSTISFLTVKYIEPNSIFTIQLAKRGELITHHKDKAVLTFMKLHSVIENDFLTISDEANLGDLVKIVSKSKRNLFPVVDDEGILIGVIQMDDIREIMFDKKVYETTKVDRIMTLPPAYIGLNDTMNEVIRKFEKSGAWNLPVIDKAKYCGMVSKSKLFSAYRNLLLEISGD